MLPNSKANSTPIPSPARRLMIPIFTNFNYVSSSYSSAVARATASTTTFPTASENGGHIIEK